MFLDSLVVGCSLRALVYSHLKDLPLLINCNFRPFIFEELPKNFMFEGRPFQYEVELWNYLAFKRSIAGKVLFGASINKIDVETSTRMNIYGENLKKVGIDFSKAYVFECQNMSGEVEIVVKDKGNIVYDWMDGKIAARHELATLDLEEEFIERVKFYRSQRSDTCDGTKDLVVTSHMSDAQLVDFDYSDTMIKYLVESRMKSLDVKAQNGSTPKGEKTYRYSKVEPARRDVVKDLDMTLKSTKTVKFVETSLSRLLKNIDAG